MKNLYRYILFILGVQFSSGVIAQSLINPSFEGTPKMHTPPPEWFGCDPYSTPDTQPGLAGVTLPPTDGNSYMELVVRGDRDSIVNRNTTEDAQTRLSSQLIKGGCYTISIDLALSKELFVVVKPNPDTLWYNKPAKLEIWGCANSCTYDEILAISPPINHTQWKTYTFNISPIITNHHYLLLKAQYIRYPEYFGSILIDNLRLSVIQAGVVDVIDTLVHSRSQIELQSPQQATNYQWSPSTGLSCTDCPNPIATIQQPITYQLQATDSAGCAFYANYAFDVEFYIPNVITPNNDGSNDTFIIDALPSGSRLQIVDRFGTMIYQSDNYDNSWAGTLPDGNLVMSDNYWYLLYLPNQAEPISGSLFVWY